MLQQNFIVSFEGKLYIWAEDIYHIMQPKKMSVWEINAKEFDLDNVMLNLQILEDGPVTLLDFLQDKN